MHTDVVRVVCTCVFSVVLLGLALAPSSVSASADNVPAFGPFPKTIEGTVYDYSHGAVEGVAVQVDIWVGPYPENSGVLSGSRTTVSDAWGHYQVSFDANEWSPHYVIEVTGSKDAMQWFERAEADGSSIQSIDLDSLTTVPEYASHVVVPCIIAGTVVLVVGSKRVHARLLRRT